MATIAKSTVNMNSYYRAEPYGLVRTVCRATDNESGKAMIVYVNVGQGGFASDPLVMPESQFKNIFIG